MVKWLIALLTLLFSIQKVVHCISNKKIQYMVNSKLTNIHTRKHDFSQFVKTCQNMCNKKTQYKGTILQI